MSFSTTIDRVPLSGNGSTVNFSFPYILFATTDLKVYLKNNTTGVETLQTITTHYTVSGTLTNGVYESGVTVTFLTAPTASQTVLMVRDRDVTQELDLDENGKIPSTSLEKQLDKFATYIQRVKNKLARTVGLPEGYTASFDPTLPPVMVNDGYLKTTSTGAGLEYVAQADLINTISTGAQTFTASRAIVSDANGLADSSATTSTEIGYVNGVTSAIQTQIDSKQATITGAASTIVSSNLTASKVVISNVSGKITTTNVTHTEVDYVSGVTGQLSGNSQSATLQNKTLDNSNIVTVRDDRFTIQDNVDATKQAVFELSGITTGTTRTYTLPNANASLAPLASPTFTGTVVLPKVQYFASATGDPASVSALNPVIFPTELADPYSAYNNTTGRFTVPTGGADYYEINMSYVATGGANASWFWYKNASVQNLIGIYTAADLGNCISVITSLLADGDIIDIRPNNTVDISDGCITFKRIGGYR